MSHRKTHVKDKHIKRTKKHVGRRKRRSQTRYRGKGGNHVIGHDGKTVTEKTFWEQLFGPSQPATPPAATNPNQPAPPTATANPIYNNPSAQPQQPLNKQPNQFNV